jgi:quinol monooxygenase YgiN
MKETTVHVNQPGMVLRIKAKPGKGEELFQMCTDLHFTGDPDGPVDWVLTRCDEEPDVMWAFEFYRDDASFDRHYGDPTLQAGHQRVIDLAAVDTVEEWGVRVPVHVVSSS